jgi:hydroxypyruvate isomerase
VTSDIRRNIDGCLHTGIGPWRVQALVTTRPPIPDSSVRLTLTCPASTDRILRNLDVVVEILGLTGCRIVNALYGNRLEGTDPEEQDRLALDRLVAVADALAPHGASVVIETLHTIDSPAYPLTDIEATARVVRRVNERSRSHNAGLLADVYHLATMGTDPPHALRQHADLPRHVQFADAPGRGRPGTGAVDFGAVERTLAEIGYAGFVGLEYHPTSSATPQGAIS